MVICIHHTLRKIVKKIIRSYNIYSETAICHSCYINIRVEFSMTFVTEIQLFYAHCRRIDKNKAMTQLCFALMHPNPRGPPEGSHDVNVDIRTHANCEVKETRYYLYQHENTRSFYELRSLIHGDRDIYYTFFIMNCYIQQLKIISLSNCLVNCVDLKSKINYIFFLNFQLLIVVGLFFFHLKC